MGTGDLAGHPKGLGDQLFSHRTGPERFRHKARSVYKTYGHQGAALDLPTERSDQTGCHRKASS